jgi:PAS domain S-box-containing protein
MLPETVVHYVLRTREIVILDDAAAQSPFAADPYIRQRRVRSALCLPLLNQAKLIGVLYLENNLAPRVFAPARITVLKLLASQAAISIENARLYRDLAEREAKIRRLVDANVIGVFVWNLDGQIIEANDAFLRMVGYDREDLVSGRLLWTDLTAPEWRDHDAQGVEKLKRTGTRQPFEKEYIRKDGSRVPVLAGGASFEEGGSQGVAFVLDLTERKRAEEELRASEARLRTFVDFAADAFFLQSEDGTVLDVNRRACEILGFGREELIGMTSFDFDPDLDGPLRRRIDDGLEAGEIFTFESRHRRKDGSLFPVEIRVRRFQDRGRTLRLSLVRDITERRKAERALRESEERFRTIVQFSFYVYWESDAQHRFIRQEFSESLSDAPAPKSEIGKTRWEVPYLEPDEAAWRKHRETLDAHLPFRDFELARPTPDGGKRYVSVSGLPVFDEMGRFIGYRGVGRHITDRKRAEAALRESEEQWKAVFANNPIMYFMVDATGTIISVNPFGAEQLGYSADELIGRPVRSVFHEADREAVQRNAAVCFEQLGQALSWELRKIRKNGEVIWVRETARATLIKNCPVLLIVCEDITESKRAAEALREVQTQLAHANRVAALGQLTASIAHEVSQPVTGVLSSGYAALRWLDRSDLEAARGAIERVIRDATRAAEVIGGLRALIKKAPPQTEGFDMNAAIREVIVITRAEAVKSGVSVEMQLAAGLPLVRGDRVQLQQVMLNLIINAIEAMSGVGEGPRELLVKTAKSEAASVSVAVQDSGPGLDPASSSRAFEAFYTTKPDGLGIGLSICRSIVEAHGGKLAVTANMPRGAVFQFTVPTRGDGSST